MTDITRYSPDNISTYNAALQSLEDLYLQTGNAIEEILSGTLTSATQIIDLSVLSSTWCCVRLMTNLQRDAGVSTTYDLYANHNRSTVYGYALLVVTAATLGSATTNANGVSQSITNGAFSDVWLYFNSFGFVMVSSISYLSAGGTQTNTNRYGGYGAVGEVSSIQLDIGSGGTFAAGGTYILEGIRA